MIFTSPETRMTVLPDSENRMIVASFVSTKHRNVTERQMDRQADGGTDRAMANTALALQAMPTHCKIYAMQRSWNGRQVLLLDKAVM